MVYDPVLTDFAALAKAVSKAGYQLVEAESDEETQARTREQKHQRRTFLVGLVFTTPLFLLSMSRDFGYAGQLLRPGLV